MAKLKVGAAMKVDYYLTELIGSLPVIVLFLLLLWWLEYAPRPLIENRKLRAIAYILLFIFLVFIFFEGLRIAYCPANDLVHGRFKYFVFK
ncbi:hypothetical protein KKH23_04430 [Patescibacteria group bacterium]|nr:hypothetical protein [Patescibacteria group bacterium]